MSPRNTPQYGVHQYVVKVDRKVITCFDHDWKPSGLAQFLRDAADAVEKKSNEDFISFMGKYLPAIRLDNRV